MNSNISVPYIYVHLRLKSVHLGNICLPPELQAGISMSPVKEEYSVGDTLRLNCDGVGQWLTPHNTFTCSDTLTWEPALLTDVRCTRGKTLFPCL